MWNSIRDLFAGAQRAPYQEARFVDLDFDSCFFGWNHVSEDHKVILGWKGEKGGRN